MTGYRVSAKEQAAINRRRRAAGLPEVFGLVRGALKSVYVDAKGKK